MRVRFCGAFEGSVKVRDGERISDALQRAEDTMNRVLDRQARKLGVTIGVDHGDYQVEGEQQ